MEYKKVSELCEIKTGKYDANHAVENGKYLFYTCALHPSKANTYSFEGNLIMLPGNGANLGEVMYYKGKIEAYQRTYVLTDIECNSKYLYHYLKSMWKRYIFKRQVGSATNYMKLNDIAELEIPLPALNVQDNIAKALDKAQELIDKRKEQIEALDELVKSRFIEMFGDPINNPKGWEVKKLNDISTKILSGNTPKGGSQVYIDEGILFLRSQNVWKNRLELDDVAYIDQETHDKMQKSSLKNRDILMTKTGRINTENSSLGRAAMYLGKDDSANINGHVYLIRLQQDIINEFVLYILTSKEYRGYIRSVCVGGIDKRQINKEHLEEFPIIFPPIKLQNQFVDFVNQIDKLKFEMETSLKELEDNFNSLMQKAFKGDLF